MGRKQVSNPLSVHKHRRAESPWGVLLVLQSVTLASWAGRSLLADYLGLDLGVGLLEGAIALSLAGQIILSLRRWSGAQSVRKDTPPGSPASPQTESKATSTPWGLSWPVTRTPQESRPGSSPQPALPQPAPPPADQWLSIPRSADWFRLLAENVNHVFWVVELGEPHRHLYISPSFERVFGIPVEQLYQNSGAFIEVIHPDDQSTVVAALTRQSETGECFDQEFRILPPQGGLRWIHGTAFPIFDAAGRPYRSVGLAEDITQRKQLELALSASQGQLADVLDNTLACIVQYRLYPDNHFTYDFWSAGAQYVFGFPPDAFMQDSQLWFSRVHPEDVETVIWPVWPRIRRGEISHIEYRFHHPDGRWRWIASVATSRWNAATGCWICTVLDTDISDRKSLELALSESRSKLQGILDDASTGIACYRLFADRTWAYDFSSAGHATVFGVNPNQALTSHPFWATGLRPNDWTELAEPLMADLFQQKPRTVEYHFRHPDGTWRWISSSFTSRRDPANNCWVVVSVSQDITARKQAEDNLRCFERVVSATADAVALIDHSYTYRLANRAYLERFSKRLDEIVGLHVGDVIGAQSFAAAKANFDSCLAGESRQMEMWFEHPAVGREFISVTYAPYRELDGTVSGVVASIRNLTDLRQVQEALRSERDLLNGVMNTSLAAIVVLSPQGTIQFANDQAEAILGLTRDAITGLTYNAPEWRYTDLDGGPWPDEAQPFQQVMRTGAPIFDVRHAIEWPSGKRRLLSVNGAPIKDAAGQILNLVFTVNDITEQILAERALRESEARFRLVAENMSDLVCLHSLDGTFQYVSPSCRTVLGYEPGDLLGHPLWDWLHPDDRDSQKLAFASHCAQSPLGSEAASELPVPTTYRIRHQQGHYLWLETLTNPIFNAAGDIVQLQTTSRNVTEKVEIQSKLQHDALHDALTGLPNRSLLMERLNLALERLHRHPDSRFAVLFLDLDRFKVINDSMGHQVGDDLLVAIAHKLTSLVRHIDLAARLSGDEFVVLLEEIEGIHDAVRVADHILLELQQPFILQGREVFANTSIGIVLGSPQYRQGDELLRDADIAMYRAKANGKACYAIFNPEMHLQVLREMQLENALRVALEQHQFRLHYQPIVSLKTGHLTGVEALVRWQNPRQGLVSPGEFIPLAEETGLIIPLGHWILSEACRQLRAWQRRYASANHLTISVNLSARQLREAELMAQLDTIFTQTGLSPSSLSLEITESVLIENVDDTIAVLNAMRSQGIRLSIDDFGTGYSSLSYLHRFPFTALKIDQSFVSQLGHQQESPGIARSIVALAGSLGLSTIAEGIETERQLAFLQTIGCEYGQGFLFSPGLQASQIEELLASGPQPLRARTLKYQES